MGLELSRTSLALHKLLTPQELQTADLYIIFDIEKRSSNAFLLT